MELNTIYNAMFVDDNVIAAYEDRMAGSLDGGVKSGHGVFGPPKVDRRGDCFAPDKFELLVTECARFLGFIIDTHNMTVTWPLDKRQRLHTELTEILERKILYVSPKEMAHIVGVVRSASDVAP